MKYTKKISRNSKSNKQQINTNSKNGNGGKEKITWKAGNDKGEKLGSDEDNV